MPIKSPTIGGKAALSGTLACACAAAWFLVVSGPSITADSGYYVFLTDRIYHGGDLSALDPLYAPMLSAISVLTRLFTPFGTDAVHLVVVGAMPVTVLLAYLCLTRGGLPWPAALAFTIVAATVPALLHCATHLWTEPLLACMYTGHLACAAAQMRSHRRLSLYGAAALLAAASMTKFVALAAAAPFGVLCLVYALRSERQTAWLDAVCACSLAVMPIVALGLSNRERTGHAFGSRSESNTALAENAARMGDVLGENIPLLAIVALAAAGIVAFSRANTQDRDSQWFLPIAGYSAAVAALHGSALLFLASTVKIDRIDDRLVAPIIPPLLLSMAAFLGWARSRFTGARHTAISILTLTFLGAMLAQNVRAVRDVADRIGRPQTSSHRAGFGRTPSASAIRAFLEELSSERDRVSLTLTERSGRLVPRFWIEFGVAQASHVYPRDDCRVDNVRAHSMTDVRASLHCQGESARVRWIMPLLQEKLRTAIKRKRKVSARRVHRVLLSALSAARIQRHWWLVSNKLKRLHPAIGRVAKTKWRATDRRELRGYTAFELRR